MTKNSSFNPDKGVRDRATDAAFVDVVLYQGKNSAHDAWVFLLQMGPSGSGKTTLLDLLGGRKTVGNTEGKIMFAGNTPSKQFLRRYTGYVEQFGK